VLPVLATTDRADVPRRIAVHRRRGEVPDHDLEPDDPVGEVAVPDRLTNSLPRPYQPLLAPSPGP